MPASTPRITHDVEADALLSDCLSAGPPRTAHAVRATKVRVVIVITLSQWLSRLAESISPHRTRIRCGLICVEGPIARVLVRLSGHGQLPSSLPEGVATWTYLLQTIEQGGA